MPQLTPENAIEVINDDTRPAAERFAAMAYMNTRELFKRLPKPAANSTLPAPAAAAAKTPKPKAEADIIDTITLRLGDYAPNSGVSEGGNPWANVLAFREFADGDRTPIKITAWGKERSDELASFGPGDLVRVKVREYGVDDYNGRKTKTARSGGLQLIEKGAPKPAAPRDDYADFGANRRHEPPPTLGPDGFPAAADDIPF